MGLHKLPAELISQIARTAEPSDPAIHLTLASVCYHTRQAVVSHLYHSIYCPTATSLSTFADILDASPVLGAHVRTLRMGPWDILASASTASHDFSGVNPRATGERASEAGRILAHCSGLQNLVIWDALLGPTGLGKLHKDARLKRLSLPYLWRSGHTIPCASLPRSSIGRRNQQQSSNKVSQQQRSAAELMPQLEELEALEVLVSGLTSADLASIATFRRLRVLSWYYRPLELSEVEVLFRKLNEEWQQHSDASPPKDFQIILAANNGKLAQMEGWLAARLEQQSKAAKLDLPNARVNHLQISDDDIDPETAFLNARRAAGREGYAPGAAPVLPQSNSVSGSPSGSRPTPQALGSTETRADAQADETSTMNRPEFILGGFPTEDAEDVYARRLSEWQQRLEASQQEEERPFNGDTISSPIRSSAMQEAAMLADEQQKSPPVDYLCMAGEWLRAGKLHLDLRRWRMAVMSWELQWADVWTRYGCALKSRVSGKDETHSQTELSSNDSSDDDVPDGPSEEEDADTETFWLAHLADAVP